MIPNSQVYNISNIFITITIVLVFGTVFCVNKDLGNGIISGKYFWFYASMSLFSVVAIPVAIIRRRERLSFATPDLLILLFCAVAVLITMNHTGRLTNKCMLLIFVTVFYFYMRIFLAEKSKLIYCLCGLAFVITGLVEAIWGLRQLYGFTPSQHGLFKITGSFFNPGPYSGWLAMVFPMAFCSVTFRLMKNMNWGKIDFRNIFSFLQNVLPEWVKTMTGFLTVLSILLVLPAAMSRASWLAALGGCVFTGILYGLQNKGLTNCCKMYGKRMIVISFAAAILFAILMTGLFFLKKDSASGRAFTWKIAAKTIVEHPLGVGLGNFAENYGDLQAEYFASGAGSEREEYIAGGVEYAFNEYLQICIETGIVPFMIFLAFVGP